jgi:hypothetical protein
VLGPPEIRTDEITKTQWQVILSHMGASADEITDVQARMGLGVMRRGSPASGQR